MLDSKKTLSIARLQYINVLSDEAAKAFTTTYINSMSEEAKKAGDKFSFGNRSVVEKVFSTVVARQLFEAYTFDLQIKKNADYVFFHKLMEGKTVLNPTVSQVWKYMHSELVDASGVYVIQEMVVMDRLAYFYSEYLVDFALIGICRKTCLSFIENLSTRSKLSRHQEKDCSFHVSGEIYLNPLKWSVYDAPKDEDSMRTAYVKKLGIPFYSATKGNSVPRTFQHCMTALVYQFKTIRKLKYNESDQTYWWNMFDLTKFAGLFDTNALKMILERRCVENNVKDEVCSSEIPSNSSPKIKLYNSLIDKYIRSKSSEKSALFQHAVYNLIVLNDDKETTGTAKINKGHGMLTKILRSDEVPKLNEMLKAAKGTSQQPRNDNKGDNSKKSLCSSKYEDEYEDEDEEEEETDQDINDASDNAREDDAIVISTSVDDENVIENCDTVGTLNREDMDEAMVSAKETVTNDNNENNDDSPVTEPTIDEDQTAVGAAKENVTSVDGGNEGTMMVPATQIDDKNSKDDTIVTVEGDITIVNGGSEDTAVRDKDNIIEKTAAVTIDSSRDTIVAAERHVTGVNGGIKDTIVPGNRNDNDKIDGKTAAQDKIDKEITDSVTITLKSTVGKGKIISKKRKSMNDKDGIKSALVKKNKTL